VVTRAPRGSAPASAANPNNGIFEELTTFTGATLGSDLSQEIPPDTILAVGPARVIEMVNATGEILTKAGVPVSPVSGTSVSS
jgi:hypothetical protein